MCFIHATASKLSATPETCPQLPGRREKIEVGSVGRLSSSRRLQKGNLTELHCQRQQIITHRVQEGVSKEVHLHFNSAFHISTGKNQDCVYRYVALCSAASNTHKLKPQLSSDAVLRWIVKYFGHYTITKPQERFHYSPGLPEHSLHLYLQYPTSVPGAETPQ